MRGLGRPRLRSFARRPSFGFAGLAIVATLAGLAALVVIATNSPFPVEAGAIASHAPMAAGELEIVEIMFNAPAGDDHDWLELINRSGGNLDVSGYTIDGIGLTFADGITIPPGVPRVVIADRATFTADHPSVGGEAIIAEFDGRLADGGERLTLRDALSVEVFSARYDDGDHWPVLADGLGFSLEFAGDFSVTGMALTPDHPLAWRASLDPGGSPADVPDPLPREPIVVINEIIAATDPPYEDAIELFNPNESTVDVTGWFLSDDRSDLDALRRYSIPGILTGATVRFPVIPPFGYLVLYESEFGDPAAEGSFRLSGDGEGIYLSAPGASLDGLAMVRGADFAASETNMSYGRHPTSIGWDFAPLVSPTFGIIDPISVDEFRLGTGAENEPPRIGPLVIDELLIDPLDPHVEFVELRNLTDSPIPLWNTAALTSTYQLDDAISFFFGPGDVVPSGGRIVVTEAEPADFRAARAVPDDVPIVGPYTGGLNNAEDVLRLRRRLFDGSDAPSGWLPIDHLAYESRSPWPIEAFGTGLSMQRVRDPLGYGNDPASWTAGELGGSPGRDHAPGTPSTTTSTATLSPTPSGTLDTPTPIPSGTRDTPSPTPNGTLGTPRPTEPSATPTATRSATPVFCACDIWLPWMQR